ncbi:MAG TPA: hypothetical protein DCQ06_10395 [Myxococcales bacterium]|nr:hypothetical protein [Myxococcales bacterium]HAN31995.1 hypothetical protein [Myxococcales bacterium]|tara:strand:- start:210 stop:599 length:390 start_codon:yes stop_codon:yes gene_type:complete
MSSPDLVPQKAAAHAAARSEALARSAMARAESSELFFWWRVVALLAVFGIIGSIAIQRVRQRSHGVQAVYELEAVNRRYLEEVERARNLRSEIAKRTELLNVYQEGQDDGCVIQGTAQDNRRAPEGDNP